MLTKALVVTWSGLCGAMLLSDPKLWRVAASSVVFTLVRLFHTPIVATHVTAFSKFSDDERLLWSNTLTSLLHSTVSALLVLATLAFDHSLSGDFVNRTTAIEFLTICVSTGYFAYDLWDYVLNRLYIKAPGIIVHHVVILICYISALGKTVGLPLLSLALLCELQSAFMHLRKLMSMSRFNLADSMAYRTVWSLQWASFVFARTIPHILVAVMVFQQRALFDSMVHFAMAFGGMVLINILNLQLFRGVLSAYRKDKRKAMELTAKRTL